MHGKLGRGSISTAVLLSLMSLAPLCGAQAIAEFDLPAQPLGDSLRAIARQTNTNVLFDGGLVNGRKAPALKGQASADAALSELLAGTGLVARYVDGKTIVVESADKPRDALRKENAGSQSLQQSPGAGNVAEGPARIKLAQAQTGGSGESSRVPARRSVIELEEIVVVGTHIRGLENATVPVTVLDRAYIDSTGISTTSGLVESLPQNFALTNQSGVSIPGVTGTREQGSSINLRAVGEGTTLVLLNGRRLAPGYRSAAVDISALPLTAIERVEILTDGASALYGSDAVGGVVNFILRDDFEGAETRLRSGWADGVNEYRGSQALGNAWDSGNALVSLEYYKRDLLLASDRDFVPEGALIGSLAPRDENYSGIFTGRQQLSSSVNVFGDALYTKRDSYNFGGRTTFGEDAHTDNRQAVATAGLDWLIAGDWQVEVSGSYSRNEMEQQLNGRNVFGESLNGSFELLFENEAAQIKADGSLFELPGGNARMAIGADWRSESFEDLAVLQSNGAVIVQDDADQTVRSAFLEVYVPFVGADNARAGINRLELSLAGRYEDYSSFGSSFDPQVGLMWEPVSGLRFRGSHGTSYKAPNLVDYNLSNNAAFAFFNLDPASPAGISYQLQVAGIDVAGLAPQESESSSFGIELTAIQGLFVGLNYYRIKYTDRVANPPSPLVTLADPSAYGSLFIRDPSVDQVNEFIAIGQLGTGFVPLDIFFQPDPNFTPESVDVIIDGRRRNLSELETNGLDLAIRYDFGVPGGSMHLGLASTYVLSLDERVTPTSTSVDTVDTIHHPPDWRARAFLGWRRQGWAANLFVSHTDSYTDIRALAAPVAISSYTTVDARVAYDFTSRFSSGFLSGVTIAANVQNLLDEDPPRVVFLDQLGDMGFDPTNASAFGRFVSVEIVKSW